MYSIVLSSVFFLFSVTRIEQASTARVLCFASIKQKNEKEKMETYSRLCVMLYNIVAVGWV